MTSAERGPFSKPMERRLPALNGVKVVPPAVAGAGPDLPKGVLALPLHEKRGKEQA